MYQLTVISWFLLVCLGGVISMPPLARLRSAFPTGRIVGGIDTDISQVPYQVALEYMGFQFCGATIITKTMILSAMHCIDGWSGPELSVRLGSSQHEYGGSIIKVKNLIRNPNYNPYNVDYDVALIELVQPIPSSGNTRAISVAYGEPSAGQIVTISGWGRLKEGGSSPSQLQSVVVPIVNRVECNLAYTQFGGITDRMICAGGNGQDSCQGDSGGPLALNGQIVGIVSWGRGCASQGYPGVYTNVANPEIRKFIRDHAGV